MKRTPVRRLVAVTMIAAGGIAGCGEQVPSASVTTTASAAAPIVTLPGTTEPGTTEPATTATATSAPERATTQPATTPPDDTPSPTTTPATATTSTSTTSRWHDVEFEGRVVAGYSGLWWGDPSPPAPTSSQPPADGYYHAVLTQPWQLGDTSLHLLVKRLERCSILPSGCGESGDDLDLDLDPSWSVEVDVPLDDAHTFVVQGFGCDEGPNYARATTGPEFTSLLEGFTADFDAAIASRLSAGDADQTIADDITATPMNGFAGMNDCETGAYGLVRYRRGDGPTLLLQILQGWDGGPMTATDLIGLVGVTYAAGVPTLWFYASFYS